MVGQRTLNPLIQVRILAWEPTQILTEKGVCGVPHTPFLRFQRVFVDGQFIAAKRRRSSSLLRISASSS